MAQYEHLPIYKKAMDLAVYVEKIVMGFSRYNKYAIGTEMRQLSHRIVVLIVRANSELDKRQSLTEAGEKLEELKILARISMELKAFASVNSFECLVKLLYEVIRQNEGWLTPLEIRPPLCGWRQPPRGGLFLTG